MTKDCVIIVPIYHPDNKWNKCLQMLKKQKDVVFDLYIVDSGSDMSSYRDDLKGLSYTITKTTPDKFNHGRTREEAAEACSKYPILVYMTQDAIPADEKTIYNLLKAFKNPQVGCAYGRQLPHKDASVLAARARLFNYPPESRIKTKKDIKELGIKVSFISDTFAAYRHTALVEVGGFPTDVILGEDTYVSSKMILSGWANDYCADAKVYHSHNYSITQEFKRYFDTGVFHSREPWIRSSFGTAENEGKKFILNELKYILIHHQSLFFYAFIRDGFKFLGYRLGVSEKYVPVFLKKELSMMPSFWR